MRAASVPPVLPLFAPTSDPTRPPAIDPPRTPPPMINRERREMRPGEGARLRSAAASASRVISFFRQRTLRVGLLAVVVLQAPSIGSENVCFSAEHLKTQARAEASSATPFIAYAPRVRRRGRNYLIFVPDRHQADTPEMLVHSTYILSRTRARPRSATRGSEPSGSGFA